MQKYWELLDWREGMPEAWHYKAQGEPYPFGSIVSHGGWFNPRYEWKAFVCDERGVATVYASGDETSIQAAQAAVERAKPAELAA